MGSTLRCISGFNNHPSNFPPASHSPPDIAPPLAFLKSWVRCQNCVNFIMASSAQNAQVMGAGFRPVASVKNMVHVVGPIPFSAYLAPRFYFDHFGKSQAAPFLGLEISKPIFVFCIKTHFQSVIGAKKQFNQKVNKPLTQTNNSFRNHEQ